MKKKRKKNLVDALSISHYSRTRCLRSLHQPEEETRRIDLPITSNHQLEDEEKEMGVARFSSSIRSWSTTCPRRLTLLSRERTRRTLARNQKRRRICGNCSSLPLPLSDIWTNICLIKYRQLKEFLHNYPIYYFILITAILHLSKLSIFTDKSPIIIFFQSLTT